MACFESLLARRVLLWYILLVSFIIFPLTYDLSLGCKFVLVGLDESPRMEYQAFGIFNAAVYDLDSVERDFLGCVDHSQFWQQQTNDIAFRASRFAGGFLLAFATMATLINICLQCFSKHGKSGLWNVMRFSYLGALLCQMFMYSIFASDICTNVESEATHCWMGKNGVAGVFNFLFLLGMVIATFNSFPPRNPVFQCWTGELDSDSSMNTDNDDVESANDPSSSHHDGSVSLFGTSRAESRRSAISRSGSRKASESKKSKRSLVPEKPQTSFKSGELQHEQKIKENDTLEEDKLSAAEEASATEQIEELRALATTNSEGKDVVSLASSFRAKLANRLWGGGKGKKQSMPPSTNDSFKGVAERVYKLETKRQHGPKRQMQTVSPHNGKNQMTLPSCNDTFGVADHVAKLETSMKYGRKSRVRTVLPQIKSRSIPTEARGEDQPDVDRNERSDVSLVKAKQYPKDPEDTDSIIFLRELATVTKLGKGGIRVKTVEKGHIVEIVDEYPAKAGEGLNAPHSSDGADVVQVRTEYYDHGSRTIKEVTHHDGSRTVVTTINSHPGENREEVDSISTKVSAVGEAEKVSNTSKEENSQPVKYSTTGTSESRKRTAKNT